jgi:hypothetical protein
MRLPNPFSLALCVVAALPTALHAQWSAPPTAPTLTADWLKPSLKDGDVSFLSSLLTLSVDLPVRRLTMATVRLPIAHVGDGGGPPRSESSTAHGNLFVGVRRSDEDHLRSLELGVWLPVAEVEDELGALFLGAFTDPLRIEGVAPDVTTVSARARWEARSGGGAFGALGLGALGWFFDSDRDEDAQLVFDYGGEVGSRGGWGWVVAELSGRLRATGGDDTSLSERTIHQLGVAAGLGDGRVQPSVRVRLPLEEDVRDIVRAVVGVGLQVRLGS